ncbi:MAG: glycosyl hydrolase [Candidatus Micrarchaeia archaeon]
MSSSNYNQNLYNKGNQENTSNVIIGVAGSINQKAMLFALNSGVKYFREDIRLEKSQEGSIKNLTNKGANFIGILDYETLGLSTPCTLNCNWTLQDWDNAVANAVKEYPEIHIWEIWNEPQLPIFQSGFQNGSTYNYYLMVRSAYNIIKSYNSSDLILCFGGDNVYNGQPTATANDSNYKWAYSAWSYGLSNYCDAISLHVYTADTFLLNQTAYKSNLQIGKIISDQLNMYENLTKKPIFITETGISSNNGTGIPDYIFDDSLTKQKLFLNQVFSLYLSKPYIKGIIWFNLIGYVNKPYNMDFGLLNNTTMQPKPAWYSFINYLTSYNYKSD